MTDFLYEVTNSVQKFIIKNKLDQENYGVFDLFVKNNYNNDFDVILDLNELDYLSSVGLRSFIHIAKLAHANKKNVFVKARDGGMVKKIIILSGFSKLMPFVE